MRRKISISRLAQIPDPVRLERYRRSPELGPRLLFFSGGTALRDLSGHIKQYSYNTRHLITPFDSGGSSALLRDAFAMPSVGDLRNRLCALADDSLTGNDEIRSFFGYRFPKDQSEEALTQKLDAIKTERDPLVSSIPQPVRNLVTSHLRGFCAEKPASFDLRNASLGNLTLAGAYLMNNRDIDAVTYLYSRLLEVRGHVRATVNAHADIGVVLQDGTVLERQHLFTGKERSPIKSPIARAALFDRENPDVPLNLMISRPVGKTITNADVVCFPMGSFYSSLIANILPSGVGSSVKRARGPRIYIPNTGHDPEQLGLPVAACVETLVEYLRADVGSRAQSNDFLDLVMVDARNGHYPEGLDTKAIEALGIGVLDLELADNNGMLHFPRVAEALLSLT